MGHILKDDQTAAPTEIPDLQQYLTFELGDESFAVAILRIREIIEYGKLTRVPMVPEFLRGVINLRGAVVPVIDLQARFGRPCAKVGRRTCIVIVEVAAGGESQAVGILVDQVNEVVEISAAEIEPAPTFGGRLRTDFMAGMGKVAGAFVVILHLDAVLSIGELARLVLGEDKITVPAIAQSLAA